MENYVIPQVALDYAVFFFGSVVILTIGTLLGMSLVYLLRRPRWIYKLIT